MGVSVYRYKVYAFVISAGFAGLAGALYSYSEQYISPNTYNFELTILFLLAIIMGGRKTRIGAILGATIIVLLPNLLDDIELFRYVASALARRRRGRRGARAPARTGGRRSAGGRFRSSARRASRSSRSAADA